VISFNLVVSCNNLDALRRFNVFLSNYLMWEKPGLFSRWLVKKARVFVEREAFKAYEEILKELALERVSIGLGECPTPMFAALYMANEHILPHSGEELFITLADIELQFEKLKKPRAPESYANAKPEEI
jgi:23S rRNA G2445 N2-methylase RlmL